jgi:hypothetical protein
VAHGSLSYIYLEYIYFRFFMGKWTTPFTRGKMVGLVLGGSSIRAAARRLKIPEPTARRIYNTEVSNKAKVGTEASNKAKVGSRGRREVLSDRDKRHILRAAEADPTLTVAQIQENLRLPQSRRRSINRHLNKAGLLFYIWGG